MNDIAMMCMEKVSDCIAKKELSPVEVTEACLARIAKQNPSLNAFVYIAEEEARKAAKKAEEESCAGQ